MRTMKFYTVATCFHLVTWEGTRPAYNAGVVWHINSYINTLGCPGGEVRNETFRVESAWYKALWRDLRNTIYHNMTVELVTCSPTILATLFIEDD
jgi:hypothetical protein